MKEAAILKRHNLLDYGVGLLNRLLIEPLAQCGPDPDKVRRCVSYQFLSLPPAISLIPHSVCYFLPHVKLYRRKNRINIH